MQDRIQEISRKLASLKNIDRKMSMFGSSSHQYRTSIISEDQASELRAFNWPEEYIEFLVSIGSGAGPYYGIWDFAKSLPSLEARWLCEVEIEWSDQESDEEIEARLKAAGATRNDCLTICDFGCGEVFLLAVRGPEAGTIWFDYGFGDASISPCGVPRISFLDWYERWLDGGLRPRETA